MTYKGYKAKIEYSEEDDCLVGRVIGINHIISFHGSSIAEVREAFKEAIDFYLSTEPMPEKPFSGRFNIRIPSDVHAEAARLAEASGRSLNQFVHDAIVRAIEEAERQKQHAVTLRYVQIPGQYQISSVGSTERTTSPNVVIMPHASPVVARS